MNWWERPSKICNVVSHNKNICGEKNLTPTTFNFSSILANVTAGVNTWCEWNISANGQKFNLSVQYTPNDNYELNVQ